MSSVTLTREDLTERPVELIKRGRQLHLLEEEPKIERILIISGHEVEARPEIVANVLGGSVAPGEHALQAVDNRAVHAVSAGFGGSRDDDDADAWSPSSCYVGRWRRCAQRDSALWWIPSRFAPSDTP